jgi:predicted RNase H-like nuclease (RuvC/YqgF family)
MRYAKMVLKMNTKVEFCGKERKFKRCPNKTLKDYQKSLEDIQERMMPLAEATRDFRFKINELEDEIGSINKHIELLEKLEDPTDSEIRECMDLTKEKTKLQKEIHELRVANDESEKENSKLYNELDEELKNSYCEFAMVIFEDFSREEFDEEADSTDLTIAPRLGELYRLATTGVKQKDIDKLYQKIVKESFR